ncbi:MAG: hypothetical protein SWO11_22520, partial [Thermodesulfobacteriota bacterium]|nr:hypothetical protein [Thermodesulfobacteriota bacterium]
MPIKVENIEWDDEDSLSTAPSGDNIEWDDETSGIELDDETRSDFIPALKLGTAGLAKGIGLGLQIPKYLKPEEPEEPMTYPSPFTTATGEPIQKTEMPATMRRMPGAAPYEEYKEAVLEPVARAGEALQEVGERAIEEHPEWQRPEELTDDWLEMLKDPEKRWRYIARAAGENIPNLAGAVAVTAATAPVLGPAALATGFGFSALLEGGFSFDELQQLTGDKEKAADIATNVGIIAGAIEMLPVGRLFAVNPGIKKAFLKKATKEMLKKSFIVRGGVEGLKQALFEGGTEGIQTFVGNVGKKVFDENQDLFKDIPESVFIGALLGGPTGTVTGALPTGQKKTQKEIKADWAKAIKVF